MNFDAERAWLERAIDSYTRGGAAVLWASGRPDLIDGASVLDLAGCDFAIRPWALTEGGSVPLDIIRIAKFHVREGNLLILDTLGRWFEIERLHPCRHRSLCQKLERWRRRGWGDKGATDSEGEAQKRPDLRPSLV